MSSEKVTLREIEHTADLGFEITAGEPATLFAAAGEALYDFIADLREVEMREEVAISVAAEGLEELLHGWLCELLAQFNVNGFLGKRCEIVRIDEAHVEGRLKGEKLDLQRHRFHTEIKGVTYHGFKLWQEDGAWHARVIFDV